MSGMSVTSVLHNKRPCGRECGYFDQPPKGLWAVPGTFAGGKAEGGRGAMVFVAYPIEVKDFSSWRPGLGDSV